MVVERLAVDDRRAGCLERTEELLRIADPGIGEHARALDEPGVGGDDVRAQDRQGAPRGAAHAVARALVLAASALADYRDRVGMDELGEQMRPQRPRRHGQPVADAAPRADHRDGEVLGELRVLEAVIHDDEIDPLTRQHPRAGDTVGRGDGRRARGEQERLVADIAARVARRIDDERHRRGPAIAARQEAGPAPHRGRDAGDLQADGRLARAADDEVADADDRRVDGALRPRAHAPTGDAAVDRGRRRKGVGDGAARRVPEGGRVGHVTRRPRPAVPSSCARRDRRSPRRGSTAAARPRGRRRAPA